MPRPPERGRELESGSEAERGREMESTEAPRAARQRGMWMGSEAEPNSRWQNGHGHMRGRPLIGPPAARGGAGADSSCLGVGGVASQRANAICSYRIRYNPLTYTQG